MPWLTNDDLERWQRGVHTESYRKLGAHSNQSGTWFGVWAPHADYVSVIGTFNDWHPDAHPLQQRDGGLWEGYVRGVRPRSSWT